MQKIDPTKMRDWQIAEAAEATLRPARQAVRRSVAGGGCKSLTKEN